MANAQELQIMASSADGNAVNGLRVEETAVLMPGSDSQTPTGTKSPHRAKSFLVCGPRKLAILSIICGLSCVGIKALLLALKAEKEQDQTLSKQLSRRSYKFAVLSILVLWFAALVLLPFLLVLVSYVLAQIE